MLGVEKLMMNTEKGDQLQNTDTDRDRWPVARARTRKQLKGTKKELAGKIRKESTSEVLVFR